MSDLHPHMLCTEPSSPKEAIKYLVILNILRSLTHLRTEMPSGDMILVSTRMVSRMPPHTMKQSKRLKRDTKYAWRPRLYIFSSISAVNRASSTLLAVSVESKEKQIKET